MENAPTNSSGLQRSRLSNSYPEDGVSRPDTFPPQYLTSDHDRKTIVPGLEAFGFDLVAAWRDLRNVNNLCARCRAIPWHLFQFEERDFDDPGGYTDSSSSDASVRDSRSDEDTAPRKIFSPTNPSEKKDRLHISRADPMGPYIKFWNRRSGPRLDRVRKAAHQGCHLCSLIMASFLVYRLNCLFGTSGAFDDTTEVSESDNITLTGRVYKDKSDGSYHRYLYGRIGEAGPGVSWIRFRFPVLDKEVLGHGSSKASREVTVASQAESIAKFWLDDCLTNHDCGCGPVSDPPLPSRVIDVLGLDGQWEPVLLETNGIRAKYAALSYRWGKCKLFRTTRANYAEHCLLIRLRKLPTTFKDAIFMTKALGLRYLWIDALCIVQDSAEDCQRELGSMAQIYANSTVTIAAVGATSADSGFNLSRNKLAMVDCQVSPDTVICANFMGQDYILDSGTLHSRAWCFQEVQLSPRILSCGAKELYFQCHRGMRREGRPLEFFFDTEIVKKKIPRAIYDKHSDRFRFCDHEPTTDPAEIYKLWYKCVRTYTKLDVTNSNDKLTAISGLASRLLHLFKDDAERPMPQDYIAGLWRADLVNGLVRENVFYHQQQRQPVQFRAPSWSWAATDAVTFSFPAKTNEFCCEVLEATTTPVSDLNPFGPIRSGKITLYGPVSPLPISAVYRNDVEIQIVSWDYDVSRDHGCVCLMLTANYVLVLNPVRKPGVSTGVFQRAGILNYDFIGKTDDSKYHVKASEFNWRPDVVTLI